VLEEPVFSVFTLVWVESEHLKKLLAAVLVFHVHGKAQAASSKHTRYAAVSGPWPGSATLPGVFTQAV
jgi:hypothetical protein